MINDLKLRTVEKEEEGGHFVEKKKERERERERGEYNETTTEFGVSELIE